MQCDHLSAKHRAPTLPLPCLLLVHLGVLNSTAVSTLEHTSSALVLKRGHGALESTPWSVDVWDSTLAAACQLSMVRYMLSGHEMTSRHFKF